MRPTIQFGRKPLPQWLAYLIVLVGPVLVPVVGLVGIVAIELFAVFLWITALVISPVLWTGYQLDRFLMRQIIGRYLSGILVTLLHFLMGAVALVDLTILAVWMDIPFWTLPACLLLTLGILHNMQLAKHYDL